MCMIADFVFHFIDQTVYQIRIRFIVYYRFLVNDAFCEHSLTNKFRYLQQLYLSNLNKFHK